MFTNLRELIQSMPDEQMCRDYLAEQRWHGKPVCPYCNGEKAYRIEKGRRYKCGNPDCYKKFSVTVGTVMEASNIPLVKWFTAIYLSSAHKKGISSYQLGKDIGVSQKCAWFLLHRIRVLMRVKVNDKLDNIVEIDESWIGGKVKNMTKSKRASLRTENGGTIQNKVMVMGMVERGGNLKLFSIGREASVEVLQPVTLDNVDKQAVIVTDSHAAYEGLINEYTDHQIVNHAQDEYVNDVFHTNTIEGAFSILKRSIYGIYHHVSARHLSRYCDETMFRYNLRKMKDAHRFVYSLQNVEGRLTYKTLIAAKSPLDNNKPAIESCSYPKGTVLQIKFGQVVATFPNGMRAAEAMQVKPTRIYRVLKGLKKTCKGFEWKSV